MFVLETMVKNSLLAWGGAVYLSIGHTVPSTNTIEESIPVWHRPTINYCGKTKATAAFQSAAPVDGAWCNSLGKRCKLHALTHRRLHYNPIWMRYGVKRPSHQNCFNSETSLNALDESHILSAKPSLGPKCCTNICYTRVCVFTTHASARLVWKLIQTSRTILCCCLDGRLKF